MPGRPTQSIIYVARSLSGLVNRAFNAIAVSVETIVSVKLGYRAAGHEGAEIEWQCEFWQHTDADSTMEDVFLPDPPTAETSLEDSAVEPDLLPQDPPETTYHLVQEGTIRRKTKLVTNTGSTFNIRKRGPKVPLSGTWCSQPASNFSS